MGDVREGDLHIRVPAVANRLAGLRRTLAAWAERVGLAPADREALTLASYEAMANSVEHAYAGELDGVLDLRAKCDPDQGRAIVTVTDYGQWRPPPEDPGPRGRGLALIRGLTAAAAITPSSTGTTVSMSWLLPRH